MTTPSRRPLSRDAITMLEAIKDLLTAPWPADYADLGKRLELIASRANRLCGALDGLVPGYSSPASLTRSARTINDALPVTYTPETPEQAAEKEQRLERMFAHLRRTS